MECFDYFLAEIGVDLIYLQVSEASLGGSVSDAKGQALLVFSHLIATILIEEKNGFSVLWTMFLEIVKQILSGDGIRNNDGQVPIDCRKSG